MKTKSVKSPDWVKVKQLKPAENHDGWNEWPALKPKSIELGDDTEYLVRNELNDVSRCIYVRGRGFVLSEERVNGCGFALRSSEIKYWSKITA
jgi:hypothetical protein